jgi:SAM-dependent methyltransferase
MAECAACGAAFVYPQPSDDVLAIHYNEQYYGKGRKKFLAPVEAGIRALTWVKWRGVRHVLTPGARTLDIGCGRGTLVRMAREAGFEAYGIERPSPEEHPVPNVFYKNDLAECSFPDGHFRLVTIWHVLEHLREPLATLQEIHRILEPGGWLSVAVPNFGGTQAEAAGALWFHLDLPRHLWHFRRQSLEALLARAGFRPAGCSTFSFEYDWYGTLQSWMNRAWKDDNRLYSILKGHPASSSDKAVRLAAATALAGPALGSALCDAARARGGTLNILAERG